VVSAYGTSLRRTFAGNTGRFVVVAALIAVSVAIMTGVGSLAPRMRSAVEAMRAAAAPERHLVFAATMADKIQIISRLFAACSPCSSPWWWRWWRT